MPGLTASLAVAAAAALVVHPVAHPPAVPRQAAEPCVIILPLDPGSRAQLQDLLRDLLAALEGLAGEGGTGAAGDPEPEPRGADGTGCPADTGRTGNAAAATGAAPAEDGTAPPRGTDPEPADDPGPRAPGADGPDTGADERAGADEGTGSGDGADSGGADGEGSGGGSGGDGSGGGDTGGDDSGAGDPDGGEDDDAGRSGSGSSEDDESGSAGSAGEDSAGGESAGAEADSNESGSNESGSEESGSEETGSEGADVSPASVDAQAAGGSARNPGDLLDLQNFFLTLPVGPEGDPDSIDQPELLTYTSEHFELTPEGDGVVFRAPAGGVTTENSKYPRSELREMNGEEKAAWTNTSGTHVLETRQAITEVPPAKPEVVAAQIHDGGDDVLQIRLEGQTLVAQYADGEEQIVIDPAYRLGTPYDLRIVAADGRITVFYDGEQRAEIARSGSSWYFKVGAYTQSNPERGDSPDAVGEVVVYSLSIEHTGV